MASYTYENMTIPEKLLHDLICIKFPAKEVYETLNITCHIEQAANFSYFTTESNGGTDTVSWTYTRKLLVVATAVIFLVGMTLNLGLLSFLYIQKRLFKTAWCYVFNLAVTDVLVLLNMASFIVIISLPGSVMSARLQMFLFPTLDMFVSSASMLSVAGVAFDKVLKHYFSHSTYNGRRSNVMKFILLGIWIYCFTIFGLSIARVFRNTTHKYNMFVFWLATLVAFIGALLVTAISCVALIASFIKRKMLGEKSINTVSVESLVSVNQETINAQKSLTSRSVLKSLLMVMACLPFLMGWSFYLSVQTYEVVNKTYLDSPALNMAMLLVPWIISALNPLIFILTQKSLRKGMGKICRRKGARNIATENKNKQLTIV